MKKKTVCLAAIIALGCCAAFGVFSTRPSDMSEKRAEAQDGPQKGEGQEAPPVVVAVEPAAGITSLQPRQYAGRLEAIEEVDIDPRINGWIENINFEEGDFVNEGDLLFELEDTSYQAAYKTAQANLDQAKAVLKNAQTSHKRAKDLLERQAGSQADFDNAEQALAQAQANVAISEAKLVDAENTLSYTRIKSPIAGRIGKVTVSRGNLVTPQTGKIVDVRQFSPIYVKFAIGASVFNGTFGGEEKIRDLALLRVCPVGGSRTDAKAIESYPTATIDFVDNHVDSSTNTLFIWAELENADELFFPGAYATVMLSRKLDRPYPAVLQSAIQNALEGNYVWVVKDGKAEQRFVKLGPITENYYVIESGVEIGEDIVVEGMNKVTAGATISAVPYASWETSAANGAPEEASAAPEKAPEAAPEKAESPAPEASQNAQ